MDLKSVLLVVFFVSLFLFSGLFVGSISGQVIRGDINGVDDIESLIIIVFVLLFVQVVVSLWIGKSSSKKETDMHHYVKQAREEVY